MTRPKPIARRGKGEFRSHRVALHPQHMENLKIKALAWPALYAALLRWCKRGCPKKFAAHVGGAVTLQEAKELARVIGKDFWGVKSRHVRKTNGERQLRWPFDEERIIAGLHILLTEMTARHDVKWKAKKVAPKLHKKVCCNGADFEAATTTDAAIDDDVSELNIQMEDVQMSQRETAPKTDQVGFIGTGVAGLSIGV